MAVRVCLRQKEGNTLEQCGSACDKKAQQTSEGQEYKSTLQKIASEDVAKTCMTRPLPNFLAITGVVSTRQKEGNEKTQVHDVSHMSRPEAHALPTFRESTRV